MFFIAKDLLGLNDPDILIETDLIDAAVSSYISQQLQATYAAQESAGAGAGAGSGADATYEADHSAPTEELEPIYWLSHETTIEFMRDLIKDKTTTLTSEQRMRIFKKSYKALELEKHMHTLRLFHKKRIAKIIDQAIAEYKQEQLLKLKWNMQYRNLMGLPESK